MRWQNGSVSNDDVALAPWAGRYPSAEITPADFEQFVADVLRAGEPGLEGFAVTSHEKIEADDGTYDFDATVRYRCLGMDFLVLVEAKYHANPIKRELVQILYSKAISVGAHKALLISKSHFQRGAIEYAKVHGIALVSVTEGRFTYETRGVASSSALTREAAAEFYGLSTFVGVHSGQGSQPGSTVLSIIDIDNSRLVQKLLFGVPPQVDKPYNP